MKTKIWMVLAFFLATLGRGQEFNNIDYLCADWGPAMTLPAKAGEQPKYSETEEEVYFLKQVISFTRKKRLLSSLFSSRSYEDIGRGTSIYLCKMKPDGSGKTELKELWHNVSYPIDTQGQTSWLDVNEKTKRIALAIGFAGTDLVGLWVMNLDGTGLKRIVSERTEENRLRAINTCSWTPDGQCIVFEEELRGTKPDNIHRLAKCKADGTAIVRLTSGTWQEQPVVSPNGQIIVYSQVADAKTGGLYLMNIDGSDQHLLPNPADKRYGKHSGTYPMWSPDGRWLFFSAKVVDAENGKILWRGAPKRNGESHSWGWAHWGKPGIVGYNLTGILFTDSSIKELKVLGESRLVGGKGGEPPCRW